jgi:hypothetical protein
VEWAALADRQDQLRLLAAVAVGLGASKLADYEPASEKLAGRLYPEPEHPEDRHLRVMRFVQQAGGD